MRQSEVSRLFSCGTRVVHRACRQRSQCCCCTSVGHSESRRHRERQSLNIHNRLHNLPRTYLSFLGVSYWDQAGGSKALLTLRNICRPTEVGQSILSGGGMPDLHRPVIPQGQKDGVAWQWRGIHTGNDLLMWYINKADHNSCMHITSGVYGTSHIRQKFKGRKKAKSLQVMAGLNNILF